jgi:hypothetical protein
VAAFVTTVALATVVTAAAARAEAALVTLRVESFSAPAPLFEGTVETLPHEVDGGDGSGSHPCEGPTGGAPTATGALDDALRKAGISWRGNWNPSIHDFFVDRIGPYASASPDRYWSLTVNGSFSAGGCLTSVADGDAIRFYYGPLFGAPPEDEPVAPTPPAGQGPPGPVGPPSATKNQARVMRGIARRATRYLRSASGVGSDWASLALALRDRREPVGLARGLRERLRRLPGGRPIGQDVDLTALAAWSLAARGRLAAARRAAAFVRSAQGADGGFPAVPGGDSNAQSTGVALIALRVAGLGPRPTAAPGGPTPLDYLASLARPDDSIAYQPGVFPTPVWTTAQVLLGVTTKAKLMQLDTLQTDEDRTTNGRGGCSGRDRGDTCLSSSGVARPPRPSTTSPYRASRSRYRSSAGWAG